MIKIDLLRVLLIRQRYYRNETRSHVGDATSQDFTHSQSVRHSQYTVRSARALRLEHVGDR